MINDKGIIVSPVEVSEPYRVMGIGAYNKWWDEAYVCSNVHGRINMWARYKPVSWDRVSFDDTFDNATSTWAEKPITGDGGWGKPWFYGSSRSKTYYIPEILHLADIGSNGIQNENNKWGYNPPLGSAYSIARISDFLGYNPKASYPIYVTMQDNISLNTYYFCSISTGHGSKEHGEWLFEEVMALIGDKVYAGITINNITKKEQVTYVREEPLSQSDFNFQGYFSLDPQKDTPIKDGGFGHHARKGDEIEIFLFLSTSPGAVNFNAANKFSAYLHEECKCYIKAIVDSTTVFVNIRYSFSNVDAPIDNTGGIVYYVNDRDFGQTGNIYSFTKTIRHIFANLIVRTTPNSDYSSFIISLKGNGTLDSPGMEMNIACPTVDLKRWTDGNFNLSDFAYILNDSGRTFTAYESYSQAVSMTGGRVFNGIPIYDAFEYPDSGSHVTKPINDRQVMLSCDAFSGKQTVILNMGSENTANVIYRD